jgi:hypothetical protein
MALIYKKEHGFPIDLRIETEPYEEVMEDNEIWRGFKSIVIDEEENIITSFVHSIYRDRIRWVSGFMEGIKYKEKTTLEKNIDELFNTPEPWKGPEIPLLNDDETSNMEVGDWIVTKEGKVQKIMMDSQEDLPFEIIERFATSAEAKNAKEINELVQDLKREKVYNKSAWDTYGSELCAGDMINKERALENKIAKLRTDENS